MFNHHRLVSFQFILKYPIDRILIGLYSYHPTVSTSAIEYVNSTKISRAASNAPAIRALTCSLSPFFHKDSWDSDHVQHTITTLQRQYRLHQAPKAMPIKRYTQVIAFYRLQCAVKLGSDQKTVCTGDNPSGFGPYIS